MTPQEKDQAALRNEYTRLVELLGSIGFDTKFYAYFAAHRGDVQASGVGHEQVVSALASLPIAFKFQKKEKFFAHIEKQGPLEIGLHVKVHPTRVEPILVLKTRNGHVGEPFTLLAMSAAKRRNSAFEHTPPFPQLPFGSRETLDEALQFAVSMFEDVKQAVLTEKLFLEL